MADPKYAYRLCPCNNYDVEGIQTWLEDLSREGLHLSKEGTTFGLLTFEHAAPRHFRYRMEAIGKSDGANHEFHDIAAEFGWEYVCDYGSFQIFRSGDPQARELNTDPAIQAATIKRLTRQQIIELLLAFVYLFVMSLLRHWNWFRFYYSAIAAGPLATFLFIFTLLMIPFRVAVNLYHLFLLRRNLKTGLLNRRKDPEYLGWLRVLPYLTLCFGLILQVCAMPDVAKIHDVRDYSQDPPFVTLADFSNPSDTYEYSTFLDDYYNRYALFERSVAPVNMEWTENISFTRPDGTTYSGHMILTYHETCGEWFAEGLANDYYTKDRLRYDRFEEQNAPNLGVDSIRVYSNHSLYVLIQHNNIVVRAVVSLNDGDTDPAWLRWASAMAQQLLNAENPDA